MRLPITKGATRANTGSTARRNACPRADVAVASGKIVANADSIREHGERVAGTLDMAEGGGGKEATGAAPEAPEALRANAGIPDIFISYASQDASVADAVVRALERAGLKCWISPRDVIPGALYADEIVRAINEAKVVVLILSEQSVASPHVGKEIERASSKRRRIVALRTDSASLTRAFEYFLSESQWIDVGSGGMEAAAARLVDAVRRHLAPASAIEPSVAPQRRTLDRESATPRRRLILMASATLLAMVLAYFVVEKSWLSKHSTADQQSTGTARVVNDKSIAVLPFADLSEKKDQEYFADGMAEEIQNLLTKIPGLRVFGRTSSFQFKGHTEDLHAIGEKLGTAYVVEGSVRRGGSRIRVTAQLFDSRSGIQLWAESYDREFGDVLALQDQIATNIARALQLAVATDDAQLLRQLKNPEAYALYLRGRSAYDRGEEGLREAQANFEQVLALEPTFSRAAEALALTDLGLIGDSVVTSGIGWPHAVSAAKLALRLDSRSAFAHVILGLKLATYDYDWAGAAAELDAALATKSRDPVVLYNSAWLAFDVGRYEDAVRLEDASLALDPLNPDSLQNGAITHYMLGHLDVAERAFRKSLEVSPTFAGSHGFLGKILLVRGQPREALKEMEAELSSERDADLALVYHALGRRSESDAALARAKDARREFDPIDIAVVHAYRGEVGQAFEWLDKAIAARDITLVHTLAHEPLLASLRADPRYSALLHKMQLPE
jgi:TolB-like protein